MTRRLFWFWLLLLLAVPAHGQEPITLYHFIGSAQGPNQFYVGYEVSVDSPTGISALDRSIDLGADVQVEQITISYTCHPWQRVERKKLVLHPCGLVLFSVHDGTRTLFAPLILYGDVPHAFQSFTVPARTVRTLYYNIQAMGGGVFELQMVGQGR